MKSLMGSTARAFVMPPACTARFTKPFCDSSHKTAGFRDPVAVSPEYQPKALDPGAPGAQLRITLRPNGPLRCFGEMQLADDIVFGTPVKPFPTDFPALEQDTRVVVTAANDKLLECRLRYRPVRKGREKM